MFVKTLLFFAVAASFSVHCVCESVDDLDFESDFRSIHKKLSIFKRGNRIQTEAFDNLTALLDHTAFVLNHTVVMYKESFVFTSMQTFFDVYDKIQEVHDYNSRTYFEPLLIQQKEFGVPLGGVNASIGHAPPLFYKSSSEFLDRVLRFVESLCSGDLVFAVQKLRQEGVSKSFLDVTLDALVMKLWRLLHFFLPLLTFQNFACVIFAVVLLVVIYYAYSMYARIKSLVAKVGKKLLKALWWSMKVAMIFLAILVVLLMI